MLKPFCMCICAYRCGLLWVAVWAAMVPDAMACCGFCSGFLCVAMACYCLLWALLLAVLWAAALGCCSGLVLCAPGVLCVRRSPMDPPLLLMERRTRNKETRSSVVVPWCISQYLRPGCAWQRGTGSVDRFRPVPWTGSVARFRGPPGTVPSAVPGDRFQDQGIVDTHIYYY